MSTPSRTVGILSMQRVPNYGSFLQAYALRKLLETRGAAVSFIDIEPGRPLKGYETGGIAGLLLTLRRLAELAATGKLGARLRGMRFLREIDAKFRNDYQPLLGLDQPEPARYDVAVIGSDEVFNCCQRTVWGFTTQLYGTVGNAAKAVSYAGSFGRTTYGEIERLGLTGEIAAAMSNLSAISVRDDNSAEIVARLTGREPLRHLDPVLIYDFSEEIARCPIPEPGYILVYSYQTHVWDRDEIEAVRRLARKQGKRIVSIFCQYDWCDEAVIPDTPFDVLAYFKGADYVVTETFHGTIFSVITQSRFATLLRDSNRLKLTSLLRGLGLEQRILPAPDHLERLLTQPVDYAETTDIITKERQRTAEYLAQILTQA